MQHIAHTFGGSFLEECMYLHFIFMKYIQYTGGNMKSWHEECSLVFNIAQTFILLIYSFMVLGIQHRALHMLGKYSTVSYMPGSDTDCKCNIFHCSK
jgi:low affinity Fe/Cu permease